MPSLEGERGDRSGQRNASAGPSRPRCDGSESEALQALRFRADSAGTHANGQRRKDRSSRGLGRFFV